jgi:prepilin-type N-terminal cleavage/methylation domain-containing protein
VRKSRGFTFIELLIVVLVFAIFVSVAAFRTGFISSWSEEQSLRRLLETIHFLYFQASADQAYYRLEFDFESRSYRVGVVRPEGNVNRGLNQIDLQDAGLLTIELADFLNPWLGDGETLIPPPNFPSLADRQYLPQGVELADIKTASGTLTQKDAETASILFSPRGFSEFAVIHLRLSGGQETTILINPFTGEPELFWERKDFQWTFANQN